MQTIVKEKISLSEIWHAYQRALATYAYDHNGQRVKVSDGKGGVSLYPSKYFNASYDKDGKTVSEISHIFAGDTLLSTFEKKASANGNTGTCVIPSTGDFTLTSSCTIIGNVLAPASVIVNAGKVLTITANSKLLLDLKRFKLLIKKGGGVLIKKTATLRQVKTSDVVTNSAPTVAYILTDHLGSVAVSTNAQGAVTELSDYYPYGSIRTDTGSFKEQRKFIGQEFDPATNLSYLNARYYDGNRGQFLNQDPVFWGNQNLGDPQSLNSYSYANNNPINRSDPSGLVGKETVTNFPKGFLEGVISNLKTSLAFFTSNPFDTGHAIASSVKAVMANPSMVVKGVTNAFNKFANSSDAEQGVKLGFIAGSLIGPKGLKVEGKFARLADDVLVCRGGLCTAEEFINGTGVKQHADGTLSGVSILVGANGESKAELLSKLPSRFNGQASFTTLGEIRKTTATLTDPSESLHANMSGLNVDQFVKLFSGFNNP